MDPYQNSEVCEESQVRALLGGDVLQAAPRLLGAVVRANGVSVRLTEVEAYGGSDDPGSHAHGGRTRRNASMFGPPGTAYVYFSYGMHWCLNVSCGAAGRAAAVLLRAGAVVEGRELARVRRTLPSGATAPDRDLARGPARLARALGVDGSYDGLDLLGESPLRLMLLGSEAPGQAVATGPRVGVGGAGAERTWRFWIGGEPTVSPYRPATPRRRRMA
jgi:DNA-3-methyladenine glycosylase